MADVVVIVAVPRATLDACSDRDTLVKVKADPALLRNEMSGIVGFLALLQLQSYPPQTNKNKKRRQWGNFIGGEHS